MNPFPSQSRVSTRLAATRTHALRIGVSLAAALLAALALTLAPPRRTFRLGG